jgi:hypothetical protein
VIVGKNRAERVGAVQHEQPAADRKQARQQTTASTNKAPWNPHRASVIAKGDEAGRPALL